MAGLGYGFTLAVSGRAWGAFPLLVGFGAVVLARVFGSGSAPFVAVLSVPALWFSRFGRGVFPSPVGFGGSCFWFCSAVAMGFRGGIGVGGFSVSPACLNVLAVCLSVSGFGVDVGECGRGANPASLLAGLTFLRLYWVGAGLIYSCSAGGWGLLFPPVGVAWRV